MKIGRIIHQQVFQLKWHFLACLGLIMVLPLEEGFVNFKDGEGFYSSNLTGITVFLAPFLAALIACANVQADMDEKRYLFWRSKPVGVKSFMILKYVLGLLMAFVMIASPILFTYISCKIVGGEKFDRGVYETIIIFQVISLLAYSLCFLCNVLIRKTARAWLVGMALTGFLLLVPFILPMSFREVNDILTYVFTKSRSSWRGLIFLLVAVAPSLLAVILSLIAAVRNWHLKTNLKGLLWTGAAIIFLLAMFFSRQVANIKALNEMEVPDMPVYSGNFYEIDGKITFGNYYEIETQNNQITLKDIYVKPSEASHKQQQDTPRLYEVEKGLNLEVSPNSKSIRRNIGNDIYSFSLGAYYHREEDIRYRRAYNNRYEKVYLCSYKHIEGLPIEFASLELSDCIDTDLPFRAAIRQIENTLVVFIQDSFAVVKITGTGGLELVNKKINGLKEYYRFRTDREKTFKIPFFQVHGASPEECVRLSLDINYCYCQSSYYPGRKEADFMRHSLVDVTGNKVAFCLFSGEDVARYDVVKWDNDYVYCMFRDARPFFLLEQMFRQIDERDTSFVQNGRLYAYEEQKLVVFDIRSDRLRKLGNWERLSQDFHIRDIAVLDNGNILLRADNGKYLSKNKKQWEAKKYLYLLKNPE
jgi:hypothetical protein